MKSVECTTWSAMIHDGGDGWMELILFATTVNQEIHAALKSCGFSLKMISRKSSVSKFAILGGHMLHMVQY